MSQFFEMFEGDEYPLIKLGDYTDLTWGDTNTTKNSYVTEGYLAYSASGPDGKLDHYDYDCEGIVLSAIGADCGKTWFASGKWSCIKNTIRFWSTFDDLDNRFLYFATREKDFWPRRGGAQPFIPQGDARNCSIPLPPICLQRKFVEIAEQADKSEFVGCKSQFIEMFKGDNQVPLGDICNIEKGATITRNDVLPGEVPVVAGGQEPSCYHNVANREAGAITVSASGAYAGYINFWNCPIFASDCNTIISKDDEKTDQTFVYFGLRAMQKQIYGLQKGGAQPHVYGKDLQKFMFPCPSYAKQIEFSKMAKQADKSYRNTVSTVILLSQHLGAGSEIIRTSYVGNKEVQIGFHRVIFDTAQISPGGTVISLFYTFGRLAYGSRLVHTLHKNIPFRKKAVITLGNNRKIVRIKSIMTARTTYDTGNDSLPVNILF